MHPVGIQTLLWLLALVFAVSAASKMSPHGLVAFRRATSDLLSPRVSWVAPLVIAAEVGTAVLVALPPTALMGLTLAAALMLAFSSVLVAAALRGSEASCHCFGALSSQAPVGHRDILRNVLILAAIMACLVLMGDHMGNTFALWLGVGISFVLASGALIAVVALSVNLRRLGIPLGGGSGADASFDTGDEELYLVGSTVSVPETGSREVILGVLSTTCPICVVAAGSFHQTADRTGALFVALVDDTRPGSPELMEELDRLAARRLLLSENPELTPVSVVRPGYAVVGSDGRVSRSGTGHTELAMSLTAHD